MKNYLKIMAGSSNPGLAHEICDHLEIPPGRMAIAHPHKRFSAQAAAHRLGIPFTGHPMFGHDIIYMHPASCGAAIGPA